jgi:hypothetical protein
MIKRALVVLLALGVALTAIAVSLYAGNGAPVVPPVGAAEIASAAKPYVVKLPARWCPVCMVTKDVWREIEAAYAGRVNLVVLDFTNDANTAASRAEAVRLGLGQFFSDYEGATGVVVVLNGRTREVLASIKGSRDFAEYRTAIDSALAAAGPPHPSR